MELYKFINEFKIEKFDKGFIVIDNMIYTNPKEEQLRSIGYKDLIEVEQPEYDYGTQYLVRKYADGDTSITVVYEVKEIPPIEDIIEEDLSGV